MYQSSSFILAICMFVGIRFSCLVLVLSVVAWNAANAETTSYQPISFVERGRLMALAVKSFKNTIPGTHKVIVTDSDTQRNLTFFMTDKYSYYWMQHSEPIWEYKEPGISSEYLGMDLVTGESVILKQRTTRRLSNLNSLSVESECLDEMGLLLYPYFKEKFFKGSSYKWLVKRGNQMDIPLREALNDPDSFDAFRLCQKTNLQLKKLYHRGFLLDDISLDDFTVNPETKDVRLSHLNKCKSQNQVKEFKIDSTETMKRLFGDYLAEDVFKYLGDDWGLAKTRV